METEKRASELEYLRQRVNLLEQVISFLIPGNKHIKEIVRPCLLEDRVNECVENHAEDKKCAHLFNGGVWRNCPNGGMKML